MDNTEVLALQFQQHLKAHTSLAPVTLCKYKTAMKRFLGFVTHNRYSLSSLDNKDLVVFLDELCMQGYSPSAVQECAITLKKFFLYLHESFGYRNIAYDIQSPVKPEVIKLTRDNIKTILRYAADHQKTSMRDSLIIYLYFACKVPPSSIVTIMQKEADSTRGALFDSERTITILLPGLWAERLRAFMQNRDKGQTFLFYGNNGHETFALTQQAIIRIIRDVVKVTLEPGYKHNAGSYFKDEEHSPGNSIQFDFLKKLYAQKHPRA